MIILIVTIVCGILAGISSVVSGTIIALLVLLGGEIFFIVVVYLKNILDNLEKNTVLIKSRKIVNSSRSGDLVGFGKNFKRIKMSAATFYNLLNLGEGNRIKLLQLIKSGIAVQILISDPEGAVLHDFIDNKVLWENIADGEKSFMLKHCKEWLSEIVAEYGNTVSGAITDKGLYYSCKIMYAEKKKESIYDYIRVHLYGNGVKDEDRQVIEFERKQAPESFKIFEEEFNAVFNAASRM